jgi:tRNA threonylcarbamoyladenosine biosynthesis protein TsaB
MFLLIDTATELATAALSDGKKILCKAENSSPKDHAGWLHPALAGILSSAGIPLTSLLAVGVTSGPGSYTGLRVGMAAAKGLCFALNIPLIAVNSLMLMADAMVPHALARGALICPMIDARRMEVFTAVYTSGMKELMNPEALILDKSSFEQILAENRVIFSGSGSEKWQRINNSDHAIFLPQIDVNESFAKLVQQYFDEKKWVDTAYAEPIYLKEFYTHSKK